MQILNSSEDAFGVARGAAASEPGQKATFGSMVPCLVEPGEAVIASVSFREVSDGVEVLEPAVHTVDWADGESMFGSADYPSDADDLFPVTGWIVDNLCSETNADSITEILVNLHNLEGTGGFAHGLVVAYEMDGRAYELTSNVEFVLCGSFDETYENCMRD